MEQERAAPESKAAASQRHAGIADVAQGLLAYYLTGLLAVLGVVFGHAYLRPAPHPLTQHGDELAAFANWDGAWYRKVAEEGYRYDPARPSSIAFFPAYPLLGRWLAQATGLRVDAALLLVAHLCLAAAFVMLAAYARCRGQDPAVGGWVLVACGLWPTTFFCRMAYSESLFLLCAVTALYAMERRWPLPAIAAVCGLATATRSVGVCLLIPYALHVGRTAGGWRGRALGLALAPVCCWGVLAFMLFQHWTFDDALAFVRTQENWRLRPAVPVATKLVDLLTLEPVRSIFDPASVCCWQQYPAEVSPLFSLHLANPLYWLGALALVGVGAWKRWLTLNEQSLALALLLVPYLLRSHEMCLAGMGRFTAVVFPIYLVLGNLLARLPAPVAALCVAVAGFLLGAYSALFAAWWRFF